MVEIKGGDKFDKALADIAGKLASGKTLRVGFLEGATNSKTGASIPEYAAYNNYGTDRIPPRPFFSNMVADKSSEWPDGIAALLESTNYDVDATLRTTGEVIVGQLKDSINNGVYAPLAPSTVARKGFDKPLIDTADMINATRYEIK